MPESSERVIYERERGHRYTIINGFSRPDGMGGMIVKRGIQAHFRPISPVNQTGVFDATACAVSYVNSEIAAGQSKPEDRAKLIEKTLKLIRDFIENHPHFTREGGMNLIWRQKTREERIAEIEARAEAMKKQAEEMRAALKDNDLTEAEMEKMANPPQPKKDPELVKPVGVSGGGNLAGARV